LVIPDELAGTLPRRTRLAQKGILLAVVLAIVLVIAVAQAIWAGMHASHLLQTKSALRQTSSEVIGKIDKQTKSEYFYSFLVDGTEFTGRASMQLQAFRVSDPLPILYLPSNPSLNHPAAWEEPTALAWIPFMYQMILIPALLIISLTMHNARRLVAEGCPAVATITDCTYHQKGGFEVKYQFRTDAGESIKGNSPSNDEQKIGASVCVLYLPRNPRRNQVYNSLSYRAAQ
jgi:hypothetical protein